MKRETVIKKFATLLAASSLGIVSLGAAGCNDDGAAAEPSAGTHGGPTVTVTATPTPSPTARPKISGSQVIMIDPQGKKYTRKWIVQMAAGMAITFGDKGLPSNFCAKSYAEGIKGGGTFPAGKLAFMEACAQGVALTK